VLFWAVQQNHLQYPEAPDLAVRWEDLQHARVILGSRRAKTPSGIYEGYISQISASLAAYFNGNKPWSASRFETYGTCPFLFFVQYPLHLESKEPPELGLNAQQLGSIFHRILELVYQKVGPESDLGALCAHLEGISEGVFRDAPRKYGFRPSFLWDIEKEQMKTTLQKTLEGLEGLRNGWTPIAFEKKFGFDRTPPLTLDLGTAVITLRGFIDRVDQHDSGGIRVIDYKSGGSHLAKRDFEEGRRLQLPIYALAAQEALKLGQVIEGFYWTIRSASVSSIKLSKFIEDDDENLANIQSILIEHLQSSLSNIHAGIFPPDPPRGGCPNYCPAAAWCWRYQPGW
jgi:hypothetical protein